MLSSLMIESGVVEVLGEHEDGPRADGHHAGGQAVEPVDQVDRLGHAHHPQHGDERHQVGGEGPPGPRRAPGRTGWRRPQDGQDAAGEHRPRRLGRGPTRRAGRRSWPTTYMVNAWPAPRRGAGRRCGTPALELAGQPGHAQAHQDAGHDAGAAEDGGRLGCAPGGHPGGPPPRPGTTAAAAAAWTAKLTRNAGGEDGEVALHRPRPGRRHAAVTRVDLRDLGHAAVVAAALEVGGEPQVRTRRPGRAATMRAPIDTRWRRCARAPMRRLLAAQGAAARHALCSPRSLAVARAAEHDAALDLAVGHRLRRPRRDERVIDRSQCCRCRSRQRRGRATTRVSDRWAFSVNPAWSEPIATRTSSP